jgi:4-oxalocrotonate tautomerase
MPLVRIDLRQRKTPEYRRRVGDTVYRAMVETINVPEHDRFQVITEHLYAGIAPLLSEDPGIRPEDVLVNLVECAKENWSFGNGIASYAT